VGSSHGRVKPKTIKLVFVVFPLSYQHDRAKTGWLWIRMMCRSRATCLHVGCCFSKLALYNQTKSVGLIQYTTDITIHLHNKTLHTLYWHFSDLDIYLCIELIPISQVITYEMVMIRTPDNFLFWWSYFPYGG
jgi:hypothetical protein